MPRVRVGRDAQIELHGHYRGLAALAEDEDGGARLSHEQLTREVGDALGPIGCDADGLGAAHRAEAR